MINYETTLQLIPRGSQTYSKSFSNFPENYPKYITRARGCIVWDEVGNKYTDFFCALGANILGYSHPAINKAIQNELNKGTIFPLPSPKETELALLLKSIMPFQMFKYGKNGSDVTFAAVRLARYITGKDIIISTSDSYHGFSDTFCACLSNTNGIPIKIRSLIKTYPRGDSSKLERLLKKYPVACVIQEPHTISDINAKELHDVKALCKKYKALFILDEMVSGFRVNLIGSIGITGVIPDLACYGKAMSNGLPISVLAGKKEHMKHFANDIFFSCTYAGETLSITSAIETIKFMKAFKVQDHIIKLGKLFKQRIQKNDYFEVTGHPARQFFKFYKEENRYKLYQELIKKGYLFGYPIFFTYVMTEKTIKDVTYVINEITSNLRNIKLAGRKPMGLLGVRKND